VYVCALSGKAVPEMTYTVSGAGLSRATAGPGETFWRGPQTFSWGPSVEKISEWYILAYFIFPADCGPPNVVGPGVAYPYPTLSMCLVGRDVKPYTLNSLRAVPHSTKFYTTSIHASPFACHRKVTIPAPKKHL